MKKFGVRSEERGFLRACSETKDQSLTKSGDIPAGPSVQAGVSPIRACEPLILFDSTKCIGCHSCEVGCQLENEVEPGLRMRQVRLFARGQFPVSRFESISTACFHCNDPSCVSACPAGALKRRADGVVEHIRNRCVGCGYCVQACPFHVPKVSHTQGTMRKCSFCIQRIDRGRAPACVVKCPTGALVYGSQKSEVRSQKSEGEARESRIANRESERTGPPTSNLQPPTSNTNAVYGSKEKLRMVYALTGKPAAYGLPDPVPLNTVILFQFWKWVIGFIPGAAVLGLLFAYIGRKDVDG